MLVAYTGCNLLRRSHIALKCSWLCLFESAFGSKQVVGSSGFMGYIKIRAINRKQQIILKCLFNSVTSEARQLSRLLNRQIRAYESVRSTLNEVKENSSRNSISQASSDLERKIQDLQSKQESADRFIGTVTCQTFRCFTSR